MHFLVIVTAIWIQAMLPGKPGCYVHTVPMDQVRVVDDPAVATRMSVEAGTYQPGRSFVPVDDVIDLLPDGVTVSAERPLVPNQGRLRFCNVGSRVSEEKSVVFRLTVVQDS